MRPDWVRSILQQCQAAGVPFHLKQKGEWIEIGDIKSVQPKRYIWVNRDGRNTISESTIMTSEGWKCMGLVGKKAAGRLLDGKEWLEFPKEV
jgi:protein gp37